MRRFKAGILCFVCLLACLLICASCSAKEKVFSKGGMSITLTDAFQEGKYYGLTAYYESEDNTVSAMREDFSVLQEAGVSTELTLEEYAQTFLEENKLTAEIKTEDGITYFTYEKNIDDIDYLYFESVYRTDSSYWLFQFVCEKKSYSKFSGLFLQWAKSIRFDSDSAGA